MTDSENKPASILLADLVENNRNALLECADALVAESANRWTVMELP